MSRRIGVMGGTFDPIHHGHLVAAGEARWQFDLDRVVFVPTGRPWQKPVGVSPAEDRYLMTVIATASNPAFTVSRLEVDHEGPTYTVDTLRGLRAQQPGDTRLFFITGADAVLQILTWKEPDQVLAQAEFIAAIRPGFDLDSLVNQVPGATGRVHRMDIPALAISSSDLRGRVARGAPIQYLVPDGVALLSAIGRMAPPTVPDAWISKYIFPGGYIPSLSETIAAIEPSRLWVTDIEILRVHYAETLRHWFDRFERKRAEIAALYDERFCRMWEFYLAACEMLFRNGPLMVFHMQLARRRDAVPLTRDYITDFNREAGRQGTKSKSRSASPSKSKSPATVDRGEALVS